MPAASPPTHNDLYTPTGKRVVTKPIPLRNVLTLPRDICKTSMDFRLSTPPSKIEEAAEKIHKIIEDYTEAARTKPHDFFNVPEDIRNFPIEIVDIQLDIDKAQLVYRAELMPKPEFLVAQETMNMHYEELDRLQAKIEYVTHEMQIIYANARSRKLLVFFPAYPHSLSKKSVWYMSKELPEKYAKQIHENIGAIKNTAVCSQDIFSISLLQSVQESIEEFSKNLSEALQAFVELGETLKSEKKELDKQRRRQRAMETWLPVLRETDAQGRELEIIQPPNSAAAVTNPAGEIYQAGFNTLYVTNSKNTDGYILERVYAPSLKEMRWRCSCPHFSRVQATATPYCKHIYAVDGYLDAQGRILHWMRFVNSYDVCQEMIELDSIFHGHMFVSQAKDLFPEFEVLLKEIE